MCARSSPSAPCAAGGAVTVAVGIRVGPLPFIVSTLDTLGQFAGVWSGAGRRLLASEGTVEWISPAPPRYLLRALRPPEPAVRGGFPGRRGRQCPTGAAGAPQAARRTQLPFPVGRCHLWKAPGINRAGGAAPGSVALPYGTLGTSLGRVRRSPHSPPVAGPGRRVADGVQSPVLQHRRPGPGCTKEDARLDPAAMVGPAPDRPRRWLHPRRAVFSLAAHNLATGR